MSSIWTDLNPLPFQLTYVDAGGVPTRALIAGDGPDVVCLHGTSGHLEAFTRNVRAHVEAGYRIHAIDLLGHGYTGKPDEPYEIPRYAEHVLAYLDAQGIGKAHLVGESLGGWIGAFLATDHPERVLTLQLVCAGGTKADSAVMDRIKRSTTEAVMSDDVELTRKRLNLLMANPERDVTDELVQVRYDIYHQPEFQQNLHNLLCLQEPEIRQRNLLRSDRLRRITVPTLVVWGRENPFGDVPEAQTMHDSIPGSDLVLLDDCGHWPQHEQAGRYHQAALPFLAKTTA